MLHSSLARIATAISCVILLAHTRFNNGFKPRVHSFRFSRFRPTMTISSSETKFENDVDCPEYQTIPLSDLLSGVSPSHAQVVSSTGWKNRYFGLRHGQSTGNTAGVISSNPAVGTTMHELTPLGVQQAKEAATSLYSYLDSNQRLRPLSSIVWLTSDFLRAKETMEHCQQQFTKQYLSSRSNLIVDWQTQVCPELRERYFGEYDGKCAMFYNRVWPRDNVRFLFPYSTSVRNATI